MATILFVAGLVALVAAIGALAGWWWALLAAGVALVVLAVLTELGTPKSTRAPEVPR